MKIQFLIVYTLGCLSAALLPPLGFADPSDLAKQWTQAGFIDPLVTTVTFAAKSTLVPAVKRFGVTAVILRDSGWNAELVKDRLAFAAQLYNQCGISLDQATIVEVNAPSNLHQGLLERDQAIALILKTPSITQKPILYYARALGFTAVAEAIPSSSLTPGGLIKEGLDPVRDKLALENTLFISREALTGQPARDTRRRGASVEAHELGHLLINGYDTDPSEATFMSHRERPNGVMLPGQCAEMLKSPLLHNLN